MSQLQAAGCSAAVLQCGVKSILKLLTAIRVVLSLIFAKIKEVSHKLLQIIIYFTEVRFLRCLISYLVFLMHSRTSFAAAGAGNDK